jgi:hypothetical protein
VAALAGRLPEGFDRWDLVDGLGETVAHVAALSGRLRANASNGVALSYRTVTGYKMDDIWI